MYMDNLLIASPDPTTHTERTRHVLQCMTELDLHLKLEKCQFDVPEVEYLGMIMKPNQLAMDPFKLDSITAVESQYSLCSYHPHSRSLGGLAHHRIHASIVFRVL